MYKSIIFALFFCFTHLAAVENTAWENYTGSFNGHQFIFTTPTAPEVFTRDDMLYWTAEEENGSAFFTIGTKNRKCSRGQQKLKICDIIPLARLLTLDSDYRLESLITEENEKWMLTFRDTSGMYIHAVFMANDDIILGCFTRTMEKECELHQQFVDSVQFLTN